MVVILITVSITREAKRELAEILCHFFHDFNLKGRCAICRYRYQTPCVRVRVHALVCVCVGGGGGGVRACASPPQKTKSPSSHFKNKAFLNNFKKYCPLHTYASVSNFIFNRLLYNHGGIKRCHYALYVWITLMPGRMSR